MQLGVKPSYKIVNVKYCNCYTFTAQYKVIMHKIMQGNMIIQCQNHNCRLSVNAWLINTPLKSVSEGKHTEPVRKFSTVYNQLPN